MNLQVESTARIRPLLLGLLLLGGAGCAEKSDDWYEYSRGVKEGSEQFMESQQDLGLTELEAAGASAAQHAEWQTVTGMGQNQVTKEGDDIWGGR